MTVRTLTCQVESVEDLTPDVFRVILEGRAEAIAHAPGQYLELELQPDTWVPFSIACAETGDGRLELHIQHWPERTHSARLRELLTHRNRLSVRLPSGECTLPAGRPEPLLLIAAGTGFAQIKAIVEAALTEDPDREIAIWWAVRERRDLYAETLAREWALTYSNVTLHAVVETPESELESLPGIRWYSGRIDEVLADVLGGKPGSLAGREIYLAGSPGMVYACVDTLAPLGLAEHQVHSDVFSYAPRVPFLPLPEGDPARAPLTPGEASSVSGEGES
ncbi:MAG: NAD(P)H-flavin reductase [Salinicola sp.]|uniref:FAD-binding oxidoreductase n=1 Tax=Salinicola sp. TaxID=1978524 RepID=UPI000C8DE511|nr:FAD-binding oxidoreductase [Salinicola sp.]MAM56816.1 NAD(P)H-flavin reductase [Salinicola sp.]NRB56523.1 NAD(P)H-flavin reductase [Salinicola sp.]